MANQPIPTGGYQSTWTGAIPQNTQPQPAPMPTPQPQPPTQPIFNNWNQPFFNTSPNVIMVLVEGQETVDNYPVAPNVTAFLINYTKGVFWTKRQAPDGLSFDTTKHYFFKEEDYNRMMSEKNQNGNNSDIDELKDMYTKLKAMCTESSHETKKLRKEFEDFIK